MTASTLTIWIISVLSIVAMLIRPLGIAEAWWACSGAVLLIFCGLLPIPQAVHAIGEGFDVYLFLIGMMILSELAREKGVFDWIAEWAAHHAQGSPQRLFFLIYTAGTIVTAFLSNDATAVVLTPAVLTIVRRLKNEATPHLLACAFIANAASFILPISNPANLVIFNQHMPPLGQWLGIFLLPSVASVIVTFTCLSLLLRKSLCGEIEETLPRSSLSLNGKLAMGGLLLSAAVLIAASALGLPLGLATFVAALLSTLVVGSRDPLVPTKVMKGVSWSVIPLVAGLFMIVEALQSTGLLQFAVRGLTNLAHFGYLEGNIVTSFSAALLSNGMNNLPVGLIGSGAIRSPDVPSHLAHAMLIGVDLGPNLPVTGSLATILWLTALRRENVKVTAWQFLKIGLITMPVALVVSVLMLF